MDLKWTDEQQALREALRGFLEERHDSELVRELEDDPTGYSAAVWDGLRQMDLVGLTLPPEFGGSGMGPMELVVLYEEFGRALAMTPHLVSVVVGGGLLLAAGSEQQQQAWVPGLASGEKVLTLGWYEPQRSDTPEGIAVQAKPDGDGWRLSGTKIRVPYASSADGIVVLARTGDGTTDIGLFVIDPSADGVTLTQTTVLSSEAEYQVDLDVSVGGDALVGEAGEGWAALEQALLDARLAVAAYANGGSRKALQMQVEYAKERVQFGRPIGSFQGLAHPIADLAVEIDGSEVVTWNAAWQLEQVRSGRDPEHGAGFALAAVIALAKQDACDVFKRTTKQAQQVFGGIGFTRAIDVQLYTRRAKQLELTWGTPGTLLEQVAAQELDGEPFVGVQSAFGGYGEGWDPALGGAPPTSTPSATPTSTEG